MDTKLKDIVQFPDLIRNKIGYWSYLTTAFENHLNHYLPVFEKSRTEKNIIPSPEEWNLLPFGNFARDASWKWRRQSLAVAEQLIRDKKSDTVLEIGAWNGWLTKYLAKNSNLVIAADYFVSPYDGISNIQSFAGNIVAVQSNLETIGSDFKMNAFDIIVVNHCLSFFKDPVLYLEGLIPLLKENGMIIALGTSFYKNPAIKTKQNKSFADHFYKEYNMELFIQPVKGYMDTADLDKLKNRGFRIEAYPKMKLQNMYSKLISTKPHYVSISYKK